MNNHELQACNTARTFSSAAAVVAVIATVIFSSLLDHQSLHWQIAVATVALAIGIPHGALDHLVARPTGSGSTRVSQSCECSSERFEKSCIYESRESSFRLIGQHFLFLKNNPVPFLV
jgi:low temperature requirement protein LtrA